MGLTLKRRTLGWALRAAPNCAESNSTTTGGWHPGTTKEETGEAQIHAWQRVPFLTAATAAGEWERLYYDKGLPE